MVIGGIANSRRVPGPGPLPDAHGCGVGFIRGCKAGELHSEYAASGVFPGGASMGQERERLLDLSAQLARISPNHPQLVNDDVVELFGWLSLE